jgi:hypothetical protein
MMQKANITLSVCLYAMAAAAQVSNDGLVRRGMELRDQDQSTQALECLRQAIAKEPRNLRAHKAPRQCTMAQVEHESRSPLGLLAKTKWPRMDTDGHG